MMNGTEMMKISQLMMKIKNSFGKFFLRSFWTQILDETTSVCSDRYSKRVLEWQGYGKGIDQLRENVKVTKISQPCIMWVRVNKKLN